jgi:hypothetical protein
MRLPTWIIISGAVIGAALVAAAGLLLLAPNRPLLVDASFSLTTITPNADGDNDVTEFTYEITENATITLMFENEAGDQFFFRQDEPRAAGARRVLFSGVVDGYEQPDEDIAGTVTRRLMPDGDYTWNFSVTSEGGEVAQQTGTLMLTDGDTQLPTITEFTILPRVFTPNQDGIDDRVNVNVVLGKQSELSVYLVDEDEERSYMPRLDAGRDPGEAGRHTFDYDGGVTGGADPPDNGLYTVVAQAQDDVGQVIRRESTLEIAQGGVPFAEIVGQENSATVAFVPQPYDARFYSDEDTQGDLVTLPDSPEVFNELPVTLEVDEEMLVFRLTVTNYGQSPIRTTAGPWPGTVYQQRQNRASFGAYDESGAWRVGLQCETSTESYPWRWSVGTPEDLREVVDPVNDNVYYYLDPGESAVVWGAVRMTEVIPTANPQTCWAGLIHEDVGISVVNRDVGRREVEVLGDPLEEVRIETDG